MSPLSLALAVIAAGCNALSSVLQRRANREESLPFGRRMLLDLVRRPMWLGGFLALIVSFVLQATALRFGPLASVEPVLAAELPLTLLLAGWVLGQRVSGADGATAVVMAAGLAALLLGLGPSGGSVAQADAAPKVLATAATAGGITALIVLARNGPGRLAGAVYGAAAGSGFGLSAALMKISVASIRSGHIAAVLGRWELYGMVVAGVAALVLVQAALRAGTLVAVQPGLTLLDPLVSVAWGTVVLGERVNGGWMIGVAAAGAAVMVGAVVRMSRSTALTDDG